MELLIDDFLIHLPLILPLINQFKLSIESSKGIYPVYLFPFPFLIINIITNDFPTTNQLNKFNTHINLADLIAILGSIDSALGSVDIGRMNRCFYFIIDLYIHRSIFIHDFH